jgi:hypothetical protein
MQHRAAVMLQALHPMPALHPAVDVTHPVAALPLLVSVLLLFIVLFSELVLCLPVLRSSILRPFLHRLDSSSSPYLEDAVPPPLKKPPHIILACRLASPPWKSSLVASLSSSHSRLIRFLLKKRE